MAIGTRSPQNIYSRFASVYIAAGGTIAEEASFGVTKSTTDISTLLASFSYLGTLKKDPKIVSEPVSIEAVVPDIQFSKIQLYHTIKSEFTLLETDNSLINDLISRVEGKNIYDLLWYVDNKAGEKVSYLRNQYIQIEIVKLYSPEQPEHVIVRTESTTPIIKKVFGQYEIA